MKVPTILLCATLGLAAEAQDLPRTGASPNNPQRLANDAPRPPGQPGRAASTTVVTVEGIPFLLPPSFRSMDGFGTHPADNAWGSADITLLRQSPAGYADTTNSPSGANRPNPREISNACAAQSGTIPNSVDATDYFWQWGQFLDHDISLTPEADPAQSFDVDVPAGDPWFDPFNTGTQVMPLHRSSYRFIDGVREQLNDITAYIDASNVYGSDDTRADELRTLDGTGRLKTSAGDLLPYNINGLPNAPSTNASYFLAGDFRANEQAALIAMHTLFVREHNFWAGRIRAENGGLDGNTVYEVARFMVGAEMQAITYNEFLPILLGPEGIAPYPGFDLAANPSIANEFSTAAYRFGHTTLSSTLLRLDAAGSEAAEGHLNLAAAFFDPSAIETNGIESILRGLAGQVAQEIDTHVVDDVRNFLFGPPGAGGLDLASLNLQRGRDHGLPAYNTVRIAYGLPAAATFADISSDAAVQADLAAVYPTVNDIDLWVGGLAEDHAPEALVGETFRTILADQFTRLRNGDPFFYRRMMTADLARLVDSQTLAVIVQRNTTIGSEIQANVFKAGPTDTALMLRKAAPRRQGDMMMLEIQSLPGAFYRITCSEGMDEWNPMGQAVPAAGWLTRVMDPAADLFPCRCYRVEILLPPVQVGF